MMSSSLSSIGKIIATGAMASVLVLSTVGMHGMMGSDGSMASCPFMSDAKVVCSMPVMEHLSQWQAMTRSVAPEGGALLALLLLLVFGAIQSIRPLQLLNPPNSPPSAFLRWYQLRIRSLDRILIAFSHGILNGRLFA
ncbi:hypothetical protein HZA86_02660 [Candidatus Uhrbacteria bacterium]|nr:hypothetical protein [Candidatus Uhrbacteria bacterium]